MAATQTATITTTVKKPGPPVPPRPQHTSAAASLLKSQRESITSASVSRASAVTSLANAKARPIAPTTATATATTTGTTNGSEQPPLVQRKHSLSTQSAADGRTIIYKSPATSLQQKQEEREKRLSGATKVQNGTQTTYATKPPLKLRKAPDVPNIKPRVANKTEIENNKTEKVIEEVANETKSIDSPIQQQQKQQNVDSTTNMNSDNNKKNIVIVQATNVVNLSRHHSMGSPKPVTLKPTRFSLGKADFERPGKVQLRVDQLQPSQPLPKPRKIVKMPVATLDLEDETKNTTSNTTTGISLFRRSKTTLDNIAARASITSVNSEKSTTNSFLSGKTVELKNNLKNAAERLFSEIIVNQQKQAIEAPTIITKHERAIQHQALLEQELAVEQQRRLQQATMEQTIRVISSTPTRDLVNQQNYTRININSAATTPAKSKPPIETLLNSPEKKAAFHEMLISELAAMRNRSSSMENLRSKDMSIFDKNHAQMPKLEKIFNKTNTRLRCNSIEDHDPDTEDVDEDNVEDADGEEDDLNKHIITSNKSTPRKRYPSGCSSDSSPYGTERSTRIRTSDWIEVGDNGKQVTLTSCHISLEDSGLEDEERLDDMSSSGVGDSWDSVKEAENEKRSRNVKR
ncbi:uncharacterized protein LOC119680159 [Teleopsis dalmanni]|uniref:uncharacterized protein LOC119680159 n=1 Tax=Teleopsis dalmanni TaxID=139649 RepID=UPI0018CE549B|nr:uncharacterized protein LOC119680159 [Teleopsis dalmanni]XP_037948777.1 uncharacterized protein LOC119680159 [Teleopsis dalmanni]